MLCFLNTVKKFKSFHKLDKRKKGQIKNSLETIFKKQEDVNAIFEQLEK